MRRSILIVATLAMLSVATAGVVVADATSVDATPEFQTMTPGERAEVYGSWSGSAPFDIRMCWNDGTASCEFRLGTSDIAGFFSYEYLPDCQTVTYYPVLRADSLADTVTATQQKSFCLGD